MSKVIDTRENTPWDIVLRKFGFSQNQMAYHLNCDKSKISKARHHQRGLIDQYTQIRILRLAKEKGVNITKDARIAELEAENKRLREALERLGSTEAFSVSFFIKNNNEGNELRDRIDFARSFSKGGQ